MTEKPCAKCGGEIPPGATTGRRAAYCGAVCRRAAEYEITRINRHLSQLEESLSRERVNGLLGAKWATRQKAGIARQEAEIARQEERLRMLLAGGVE